MFENTDQRILTGSSSSNSFQNSFGGNRQTIVTGASGGSSFGGGGFNDFNSGSFSSVPSSGGSSFSAAGSSFSSGGGSTFGDDPCSNFRCGSNAQCLTRSFRAACTCRTGYEGDPYTGCRRSECVGKILVSFLLKLNNLNNETFFEWKRKRWMPDRQGVPQLPLHQSLLDVLRCRRWMYRPQSRHRLPMPKRIHRRSVRLLYSVFQLQHCRPSKSVTEILSIKRRNVHFFFVFFSKSRQRLL